MTDKEYITEWSSEKSKNQLLKKKRKTQPLNEEAKPKDIKSPISIELQDAYKYSKEEMLELLQEKENQSNFALSYLPMSHCYDKSYMHKEFVDRIIVLLLLTIYLQLLLMEFSNFGRKNILG